MPPSAECPCNDPTFDRSMFERRSVGQDPADGRFAQVCVDVCRSCGAHWLHYAYDIEGVTGSGRWYRGRVSPGRARRITPERALATLRSLPRHVLGGSYFESRGAWRSADLLVPLPPADQLKPHERPDVVAIDAAVDAWLRREPADIPCRTCGEPLRVTHLHAINTRHVGCEAGCTHGRFELGAPATGVEFYFDDDPALVGAVRSALGSPPSDSSDFTDSMKELAADVSELVGRTVGVNHDMNYAAGQSLLLAVNVDGELARWGNQTRQAADFAWFVVTIYLSARGRLWCVGVYEATQLPGKNRFGVQVAGAWGPSEQPETKPWWPGLQPVFDLLRSRGWLELPHSWLERRSGQPRELGGGGASLFEALFREA